MNTNISELGLEEHVVVYGVRLKHHVVLSKPAS